MQTALIHLFWCAVWGGLAGVLLYAHGPYVQGPTARQELTVLRTDVDRLERAMDGLEDEVLMLAEGFGDEAVDVREVLVHLHRRLNALPPPEPDVIDEIFGP